MYSVNYSIKISCDICNESLKNSDGRLVFSGNEIAQEAINDKHWQKIGESFVACVNCFEVYEKINAAILENTDNYDDNENNDLHSSLMDQVTGLVNNKSARVVTLGDPS